MPEEILVIAEQREGRLKPESLELAAFGKKLGEAITAEVAGIVLGHRVEPLAREFADQTGLKVFGLESEHLALYNAQGYLSALAGFFEGRKPSYVLISHTATGWDFAPRLAVRLNGSCSTAITGFTSGNGMTFIRQICGGKILMEVAPVPGAVSVLTVMSGAAKPAAPKNKGRVEIIPVKVELKVTRTLGCEQVKKGSLDLSKAEVIVAAGRGIHEPDKLELIRELASCFEKSAVAASRPVIDAGWLPYEHQVGQTGQTVRPQLYIACGISGAIQHTAGMAGSDLIVAINTDPKANIFNVAHLGVTLDLNDFLPVLINKIRAIKNCGK